MANTRDAARKAEKAKAVIARLTEIHESRELLIGMIDEHKLDLMILALGIGAVWLNDTTEDRDGNGPSNAAA